MAAFDFPANPSNGQQYTANGVTYVYDATNQTWRTTIPSTVALGFQHLPAGMIFHMLVAVVPTGCLELNGQAISRTTYSNLFAHYGTAYGAGDGSTTFNLPDMDGITFAGRDPAQKRMSIAGGNDLTVTGKFVGVQVHTLTLAQMAAHAHTAPDHLHNLTQHVHQAPDHTHTITVHQHQTAYSNNTTIAAGGSGFVRGTATGFSTLFTQQDGAGNNVAYMSTTHGGQLNTGYSAVMTTGACDRAMTTENQGGGSFHQNTQPTRAAMCLVTTGGQ
jgi:microcystin-dependent protein